MANRKVKSTIQSLLREMRSDIKNAGPDGWPIGMLHEFVNVGHRSILNVGVYQEKNGKLGVFVVPYSGSRKLARAQARHLEETGHDSLTFEPQVDESGLKHHVLVDCCDKFPRKKQTA